MCKRILIILFYVFLFNGISSVKASDDRPILYITFSMHNEEDFDGVRQKPNEPDYNGDRGVLLHYTDVLRKLGKIMQGHGAKLDLGCDWTSIEGAEKFDPGFAMEFTAMGHIIEAHAHETHVSYLEVKNMIRRLGIEPPPIANGFFP